MWSRYPENVLIGQGGFGKVYKAKAPGGQQKGQWIAVKVVELFKLTDNKDREKARQEAELMKQFNHWSIVKLLDYSEDKKSGALYLEMEYCADGDLAKAIENQRGEPFPENQIRNWFAQLALAVKHLQEEYNIVHRDIKPLNVFLLENRTRVKLGDFGLSRVFNSHTLRTNTASLAGTLVYMSPQALCGKKQNFKDDVWSLGVLLFELATLELPFSGFLQGTYEVEVPTAASLYLEITGHKWTCNIIKSSSLRDLIVRQLETNFNKRASISEVAQHSFLEGALVPYNPNQSSQTEAKNKALIDRITKLEMELSEGSSVVTPRSAKRNEFFEAVYRGDADKAYELISDSRVDINEKYDPARHGTVGGDACWNKGTTALMFAVIGGNANVVWLLAENEQTRINERDFEGTTALMFAAMSPHVESVKALIKAKADLRIKDKNGKTALDYARSDEMRKLLKP